MNNYINDEMIYELCILKSKINDLTYNFISKYPEYDNIGNILMSCVDNIQYQVKVNCSHDYYEEQSIECPDKKNTYCSKCDSKF